MDEKRIAANFGENLKYYLAKYGVNQAELAKRLDVTPAAVSSWITGQKTPRMDKVTVLTRMFHCTVSDLLDPHRKAYKRGKRNHKKSPRFGGLLLFVQLPTSNRCRFREPYLK